MWSEKSLKNEENHRIIELLRLEKTFKIIKSSWRCRQELETALGLSHLPIHEDQPWTKHQEFNWKWNEFEAVEDAQRIQFQIPDEKQLFVGEKDIHKDNMASYSTQEQALSFHICMEAVWWERISRESFLLLLICLFGGQVEGFPFRIPLEVFYPIHIQAWNKELVEQAAAAKINK